MKTIDICSQNKFEQEDFEKFIKDNGYAFKDRFLWITVSDEDAPKIIASYKKELQRREKEQEDLELTPEEREARDLEEARKKKALSEMLITSGFTFDGYTIKKYSGYISGDDVVTIERNTFWRSNSGALEKKLCPALVKIRRQAIKELKEAAYALGCNAVIGVDFDYITMDPQHANGFNAQITEYEPYVICVTANGNAVVIEKDE